MQIERPEELRAEWFADAECVGLTAGTSTLKETVAAVHARLLEIAAAHDPVRENTPARRRRTKSPAGWPISIRSARCVVCLLILVGCGIYGATVGLWRAPLQAAFTAVKFPLLIFLTCAGNALPERHARAGARAPGSRFARPRSPFS